MKGTRAVYSDQLHPARVLDTNQWCLQLVHSPFSPSYSFVASKHIGEDKRGRLAIIFISRLATADIDYRHHGESTGPRLVRCAGVLSQEQRVVSQHGRWCSLLLCISGPCSRARSTWAEALREAKIASLGRYVRDRAGGSCLEVPAGHVGRLQSRGRAAAHLATQWKANPQHGKGSLVFAV